MVKRLKLQGVGGNTVNVTYIEMSLLYKIVKRLKLHSKKKNECYIY